MTKQSVQEANLIEHYQRVSYDMGAVRSAYGDAAAICDAIVRDLEVEYTRRGRLLNDGKAFAAIAKRCADAVWAMRDKLSDSKDQEGE